jgi:hypothetical protein
MILSISAVFGIIAAGSRSALIIVMTIWLMICFFFVLNILTMNTFNFPNIIFIILGYNLGVLMSIVAAITPLWRSTTKMHQPINS